MTRRLLLTRDPIDHAALRRERVRNSTAGAVLEFVGIVRGSEDGAPISAIDYEAFDEMAAHQFSKLFDEVERRWPRIESVRLVHRLGVVPVAEPSLWVEIASPHRAEAFESCQWLIDEMKRVVPIWKRPISGA